jgi:hypothetical protein
MLPDRVNSWTADLRKHLEVHGWEVAEIEQPFEDEWWCAELWVIQSVWSPQRVRAYLAFLLDPMGGRDDVWAVYASKERPRQRPLDDNPCIRLGHGRQRELRAFLASLHRFRPVPPQE